jgi:hypothetical protein
MLFHRGGGEARREVSCKIGYTAKNAENAKEYLAGLLAVGRSVEATHA